MDNNSIILLIFIIIIILIGLVIFLSSLKNRFEIEQKSSILNLKKSIEYSVEDGKGVHLSLGKSDLNNIHGAASIIGFETSKNILAHSGLSDTPPLITSGSGDITLLTQSTIAQSDLNRTKFGQLSVPYAYLSGPTNMSFIAGAIPPGSNKEFSSQLFVGNFGPEIGLILHESNKKHNFTFTSTDDLEGQSVSYVNAKETILGDQIYSIPYHINKKSQHFISVIIQDVLRWVISLVIILFAFLKLLGIL